MTKFIKEGQRNIPVSEILKVLEKKLNEANIEKVELNQNVKSFALDLSEVDLSNAEKYDKIADLCLKEIKKAITKGVYQIDEVIAINNESKGNHHKIIIRGE